jgi:hypothetical protein
MRLVSLAVTIILGTSLAGCTNATDGTLSDGAGNAGTLGGAASGSNDQSATGSGGLCTRQAAGCACDAPGKSVACAGPVIHDGDWVGCPEGVQSCQSDGTWGSCISPELISAHGPFSQDYASPCGAGTHVRWRLNRIQWRAPADSAVDVSVRTAATQEGLEGAGSKALATLGGSEELTWSQSDVAPVLEAKGGRAADWLRVEVRLRKGSGEGPWSAVQVWDQASECVPD